jgi:hypothetical protein
MKQSIGARPRNECRIRAPGGIVALFLILPVIALLPQTEANSVSTYDKV